MDFKEFVSRTSSPTMNLKKDGLYLLRSEYSYDPKEPKIQFIHPIVLYENGSIFFGPHFNISRDSLNYEEEFSTTTNRVREYFQKFSDYSSPKKDGWGAFKVMNRSIEIQYFSRDPDIPFQLHSHFGSILNDSTFTLLGEGSKSRRGAPNVQTYKYFHFDTKPDSSLNWTLDL